MSEATDPQTSPALERLATRELVLERLREDSASWARTR
jgi:hypothetical protein